MSKVTENKYFDLSRFKTDGNKRDSKMKVTLLEWFESLDIESRVLAVSTIFPPKNSDLLEHIRDKLNACVQSSFDLERNDYNNLFYPSYHSNNDYLSYSSNSISSYHSINTVSHRGGYLSRHITFIDTATSEDTLSLDEEILENAEGFFQILEKNK